MAKQNEPVRLADLVCAILIVYGWVTYVARRELADLQVAAGLAVICSVTHGGDVWASARWMLAAARRRVHDGGTPPPEADGPARS